MYILHCGIGLPNFNPNVKKNTQRTDMEMIFPPNLRREEVSFLCREDQALQKVLNTCQQGVLAKLRLFKLVFIGINTFRYQKDVYDPPPPTKKKESSFFRADFFPSKKNMLKQKIVEVDPIKT